MTRIFIICLLFNSYVFCQTAEEYYSLGEEEVYKKNFETALSFYLKSIELNNGYVEAYNKIGYLSIVFNKPLDAIKFFNYVIKSAKDNSLRADALRGKGDALMRLGEFDKAKQSVDSAISLAPNQALSYCGQGNIYFEKGMYKEAIEWYTKSLTIDSKLLDGRFMRSKAYFEVDMFKEAELDLLFIRDTLKSQAAEHLLELGRNQFHLKKYQDALENLIKAKASLSFEFMFDYYLYVGQCYFYLKDYDNAIVQLKTALSINPKDPFTNFRLGQAYVKSGGTIGNKEAIKYFEKSLKVDHTYLHSYIWMGVAYTNLSMYEKAEISFKKAIDLDHSNSFLYMSMGKLEIERSDSKKAIEYLERSQNLMLEKKLESDGELEFYLAEVYSKTKMLDKSCEMLKKAKLHGYQHEGMFKLEMACKK